MIKLTCKLFGIGLLFSYLLIAENSKDTNRSQNLIKIIVNEGLSQKTIDNFLKSYQDTINALEKSLSKSISIEKRYEISQKLNLAKINFEEKRKEIESLNAFIETSNAKITRIASKLYEEKGLLTVLDYFQKEKFKKFEKNTRKNMKELVVGYKLGAKILEVDKKYDKAIELYRKSLKYNRDSSTFIGIFNLQLIKNISFDKALENEYIITFKKDKESFIEYELLKKLQEITEHKEVNITIFEKKYQNMVFENLDYLQLTEWADSVKNQRIQIELKKVLKLIQKNKKD